MGQTITNLGTGGATLNGQSGSTTSADTNDPLELPWPGDNGGNYIYLPGVSGNFLSTPDTGSLDITGDIDIRVHCALDDWTPAATQTLCSKFLNVGQRSYRLSVNTSGTLVLTWTADGTTNLTATSTVAPTFTDGAAYWVRATLDVDNGAGGRTANFYTSTDGVSWTALGTAVTTAGTTSIFSGTDPFYVGQHGNTSYAAGKFYRVQVYSGIDGTKVLDILTSFVTSGSTTTFAAFTGGTITINRGTSGRKAVAVVTPVWLFGTDDYIDVADSALLDMNASQSFTVLAVVRQWATESFGTYAFKGNQWTSAYNYYALMSGNNDQNIFTQGADAVTEVSDSAGFTRGAVTVAAGVFNRSDQTLTAYVNGTASGSPTSISAIGSFDNTYTFRVGRLGTIATYADAEILAVAVFRRVLTATELGYLTTYYQSRWA